MVLTISNLILDGAEEQQILSKILKEDLLQATTISDVDFINNVIVPILHSEKTVPLTLSVARKQDERVTLQPIYASSESSAAKDNFFLNTNLLNQK